MPACDTSFRPKTVNRLLSLQYVLLALALALVSLALAALLWAGGWAHVGARNALLLVLVLGAVMLVAGGVGAAWLPSARSPPAAVAEPLAHAAAQLDRPADIVKTALRGHHLAAAGQFAGRAAHELGNLLGAISTSAQLIERRNPDPELAMLVESILRSVETAGRLTQHLSRLAAHQAQPPRRIELAEELPKQRELLQTVLGQQLALSIEVEPDAGAIEVDPGELTLALVNLAFNAAQAIRRGPVAPQARGATLGRVRLVGRTALPEATDPMPPEPCALICMLDDGIGVDEALAAQAFEPFFSTQAPGAGSGLGLSQVAAFCTQAGGVLRLRSTPGLGTAVSLLLPAALPAGATEVFAARQQERERQWLRGRHLLIVDPSDEFAGFAAALLAGHGCRLSRARDARQALDAFEPGQAAVDLALCAAELPEDVDGLALARLLKRRDPQLNIVLRGAGSAADGAVDSVFLPSPCTPPQLLAALRQAAR